MDDGTRVHPVESMVGIPACYSRNVVLFSHQKFTDPVDSSIS
jgi:hypothetical protein